MTGDEPKHLNAVVDKVRNGRLRKLAAAMFEDVKR